VLAGESRVVSCLFLIEELCEVARPITSVEGTPKIVIQGDILPVGTYFQFAGRLRHDKSIGTNSAP
jgi:hypothetical protein